MDGIAFALAIVAVGVIILWARSNDKVPVDGETTGLLAMARPKKGKTAAKGRYGGHSRPGHPEP